MNLRMPACWLVGAGLLWLGLRWFERANLYFPQKSLEGDPGLFNLPFENLALVAKDGTALHGWFVPLKPESPVILLCHGNGGNISHRLDKLIILRHAGASALMFDYRGYGQSRGRPDEEGLYLDAEASYDWLINVKKIPPQKIIAHGDSLGGAVALELSRQRKLGGLILESSFTSTVDMGRKIYPFLPIKLLVRARYDNLAKIGKISCPVLIMHSPQDDIVPFAMGRRLYEAAPEPKTFFEMKGPHNGGFLDTGRAYEEAVAQFLKSV